MNLDEKRLVVTDVNGKEYESPMKDFPGVTDITEEQAYSTISKTIMTARKAGVPYIRMNDSMVAIDHIVSISIKDYTQ